MNGKTSRATKLCGFLFLAALVVGLVAQPLSAQVTIPEGSAINSAVFHVYVSQPNGQNVYLHRVTGMWAETVVTYNNWVSSGNSYDAGIEGMFLADTIGWKTVNITSLVQAWAAGIYPNYGIAMVQTVETPGEGDVGYGLYHSSDYTGDLTFRPKLVIGYTPPGGSLTYATIQRPGLTAEQVVDTFINPLDPNINYGTYQRLYTRFMNGVYKFSVVQFIFAFTPPGDCPGTGTPGYWMNHPEAWPVDEIWIGQVSYSKALAIELMMMPDAGDKTYTMFQALVAAKLNAALGCATVCPGGINIAATIAAADAWMFANPVGSGVAAGGKNSPWRVGEPLYFVLDQYNNGLYCVPHRD